MKKLISVILCLFVVASGLVFSSCSKGENKNKTPEEIVKEENPNVEYKTLEEAESAVDFKIQLPKKFKATSYVVIDNDILEVNYDGGYIRKARGSDDISGDYNDYKKVEKKDVNGKQVTFKGDGTNVNLVTWNYMGFTFCIGNTKGMSEKEITNLFKQIK